MYSCVYQRDTLKKVLNMADIKDVKKAIKMVGFRTAVENIFPIGMELQKRGVKLQDPTDTILR